MVLPVICDMTQYVPGIEFPAASPAVMKVAHTFSEKELQRTSIAHKAAFARKLYARDWLDLTALAHTGRFAEILAERALAKMPARHKPFFLVEKYWNARKIGYRRAVRGVRIARQTKKPPGGGPLASGFD